MSKKRVVVGIVTVLVTLGFAVLSYAERYSSLQLGPSPLTYVEHRNSINAEHDVAWTYLNGGSPEARLTRAGQAGQPEVDLHALRPSTADYTTDTMSRAEDINGSGDIVGYSTDSAVGTSRHAILWVRNSPSDADMIPVDLHTPSQGASTYEITAAYGVSERTSSNIVYVSGYRRISNSTPPYTGSKPVVWEVDVSTPSAPVVTVHELSLTAGATYAYGIAYDVATDGSSIHVVGAAGGTGGGNDLPSSPVYQYAAEWFGLGGGPVFVDGTGPNEPIGTNATAATSAANRVIYANGSFWTTGYVFAVDDVGDTISKAFTSETGGSTTIGGTLSSGQLALGVGLTVRQDLPDSPVMTVGTSTTAAGVAEDLTNPSTFTPHGLYAYNLSDDALVCDINDDLPLAVSSNELATDIANDGAIIGISGGNAVVFMRDPTSEQLTMYTRSTTGLSADYAWFERPFDGAVSDYLPGGEVVISDASGCYAANGCQTGTLSLQKPDGVSVDGVVQPFEGAALDNVGDAYAYTNTTTWMPPGGTPWSEYNIQSSVGNAASSNGMCQMTKSIGFDDLASTHMVTNPCSPDGYFPAGHPVREEPFTGGGGRWSDCDFGILYCETDLDTSEDHCGSCNNPVPADTSCVNYVCENGTPQPIYTGADSSESNDTAGSAFAAGTALVSGSRDQLVLNGQTIHQPGDTDWYSFELHNNTVTENAKPNAQVKNEMQGVDVSMGLFYQCDTGERVSTNSYTCTWNSSPCTTSDITDVNGAPLRGCCRDLKGPGDSNPSGFVGWEQVTMKNFTCAGQTDDSGTAYVVVEAKNSAFSCEPYIIDFGDDDSGRP